MIKDISKTFFCSKGVFSVFVWISRRFQSFWLQSEKKASLLFFLTQFLGLFLPFAKQTSEKKKNAKKVFQTISRQKNPKPSNLQTFTTLNHKGSTHETTQRQPQRPQGHGARKPTMQARRQPSFPWLLARDLTRTPQGKRKGRNPIPPVEVGSLSHYLQGFIYPRWLFGISAINNTTNQSFFL